jgi:hypothetical protein
MVHRIAPWLRAALGVAALVVFSFASGLCGRTLALAQLVPETIVFDGVVGSGNPDVAGLEIGPWLFAAQKFHTVTLPAAGPVALADNGTPYIASVGGGLDSPITLERADGGPFALLGFDAAEAFLDDIAAAEFSGYTSATKLEVVAQLSDGLTVTLAYDLDGLRDGPGGVGDFQSFTLPDELKSITSVTFTGISAARRDAGFALDNVVVAVPEPASWAIAVVGAATLAIAIGRIRRRAPTLPATSRRSR